MKILAVYQSRLPTIQVQISIVSASIATHVQASPVLGIAGPISGALFFCFAPTKDQLLIVLRYTSTIRESDERTGQRSREAGYLVIRRFCSFRSSRHQDQLLRTSRAS